MREPRLSRSPAHALAVLLGRAGDPVPPLRQLGEHLPDRRVRVLGLDGLEEQLGQAQVAERPAAFDRQHLAGGSTPQPPGVHANRLVHHAEILSLKGDSYRLKDRDLARPPAARTPETA